MPEFLFSIHAREQMLKRNISEQDVLETVNSGQREIGLDNVGIYQRLYNFDGKEFFIRVFVNTEKLPLLIITVYKTSKIEKYL